MNQDSLLLFLFFNSNKSTEDQFPWIFSSKYRHAPQMHWSLLINFVSVRFMDAVIIKITRPLQNRMPNTQSAFPFIYLINLKFKTAPY